jgi:hypothetical protein
MADITLTAVNIDASPEAVIERGTAGAAVTAGQAVYLDGANGWKPADADAAASAQARGIVLGSGVLGTSYPSGAQIDIVFHGKVSGFASLTPGAQVYTSTTAGAMDQTAPATAGDFPFVVGWAFAADTIFVSPQAAVPVVNGT